MSSRIKGLKLVVTIPATQLGIGFFVDDHTYIGTCNFNGLGSPQQPLTSRGTPFRSLAGCNWKLKTPAFAIPEAREGREKERKMV
ncbi:hypothetical protein TNCV_89221 [Trichonephila clavipes]|nr:hypothetical protein TNCV_89221 [Trichonephila clavipes]